MFNSRFSMLLRSLERSGYRGLTVSLSRHLPELVAGVSGKAE